MIKVTSVADGIPFDPNLPSQNPNNGYVLVWNSTLQLWQAQSVFSGGGSGVTPPFVFSKDGNCTVGTYLRTGVVATNLTGQIIAGSNLIVKMDISLSATVATNTTVQLIRRTAVSTFTDISGGNIVISAGNYRSTSTGLSIALGPDWEIGAYNKSGSTLSNPVLMLYMVPA